MPERLWAPWRMEFVSSPHKEEGCLFCRVAAETDDAKNLVLARNGHALLMLNAYPYANGHLMAVPLRHTADFTSLSADEISDVTALAQAGMHALAEVYHPSGYNLGWNVGESAGAGIAQHLHMHVVPRWNGDNNFMAVTADTRVLPDSLEHSYEAISRQLSAISPNTTGSDADG